MASHMSAIGFPVATPTDFGNLAVQSAKSAQQNFSVPGVGSYRLWSPGNGVELWAQLDKENKLIGLPSFQRSSPDAGSTGETCSPSKGHCPRRCVLCLGKSSRRDHNGWRLSILFQFS